MHPEARQKCETKQPRDLVAGKWGPAVPPAEKASDESRYLREKWCFRRAIRGPLLPPFQDKRRPAEPPNLPAGDRPAMRRAESRGDLTKWAVDSAADRQATDAAERSASRARRPQIRARRAGVAMDTPAGATLARAGCKMLASGRSHDFDRVPRAHATWCFARSHRGAGKLRLPRRTFAPA